MSNKKEILTCEIYHPFFIEKQIYLASKSGSKYLRSEMILPKPQLN